jgi:hypothetical protein
VELSGLSMALLVIVAVLALHSVIVSWLAMGCSSRKKNDAAMKLDFSVRPSPDSDKFERSGNAPIEETQEDEPPLPPPSTSREPKPAPVVETFAVPAAQAIKYTKTTLGHSLHMTLPAENSIVSSAYDNRSMPTAPAPSVAATARKTMPTQWPPDPTPLVAEDDGLYEPLAPMTLITVSPSQESYKSDKKSVN